MRNIKDFIAKNKFLIYENNFKSEYSISDSSTLDDVYAKSHELHSLILNNIELILIYNDIFNYTYEIYDLIFSEIYDYKLIDFNIILHEIIKEKSWVNGQIFFSKDILIQLGISPVNDIFKENGDDTISFSEVSFFEYLMAFYIFDNQDILSCFDISHYKIMQIILDDLFFKKYTAPFFCEKFLTAVFSPFSGRQDSIHTLELWQFQRLQDIVISSIDDIQILKGLRKLSILEFEDVCFSKFDLFAGSPSLSCLSFERCNISEFIPDNLSKVKFLKLTKCVISHGFTLENMTLSGLWIVRSSLVGFDYKFPLSLTDLKIMYVDMDLKKVKHLKQLEYMEIYSAILYESIVFEGFNRLKLLDIDFHEQNGNSCIFDELPKIEEIYIKSKSKLTVEFNINKINSSSFRKLQINRDKNREIFNKDILVNLTKSFRWKILSLFKMSISLPLTNFTIFFSNRVPYFVTLREANSNES